MSTKKSASVFAVKPVAVAIAALLVSGAAHAQFMFSAPWYGNADMTPYETNNVELGMGYASTSGSGYRANEWTGLNPDQAFAIGSFNYAKQKENGINFSAWGSNLGTDSRKLAANGGQQGLWSVGAEYDQMVHKNTNEGTYFFNGLGSDNLTLPPGFPGLNYNNGQPPNNADAIWQNDKSGYGIKIDRQIAKLNGEFLIGSGWGVNADYRYDKRDGSNLIGAVMGSSGGNPRAVIVPYPVNDNTQQVNLGLNFANEKAQFNLGYYYSKYSNDDSTLTWQNPFNNTQWAAGAAFPAGSGRLDLPPDNNFQQIKADAAYNLTQKTRITGAFQYGMSRQDQSFSPYTINSSLATQPLPVDSLNGKIDNTMFDLAFNTREISKLNVKLNYHYNDNKNKTPQNWFPYVGGDSAKQPIVTGDPNTVNSSAIRYNPIPSTLEQKFLADADYQLFRGNSLRAWYQYKRTDMTPQEDETRTQTHVNQYGAEWRSRSFEMVTGKFQYTYEERRGSDDYDQSKPYRGSYTNAASASGLDNNPTLRQFHIADYDQNKIKATIDVMPIDPLALQFTADWQKRDFKGPNCGGYNDQIIPSGQLPEECLGLQSIERQSYTIDAQYALPANVNVYAFYTYAQYKNDQDSRQQNNAATIVDPNRNWTQVPKSTDNTIGIGTNWKPKDLPYEAGIQYLYTQGTGEVKTNTGSSLTTSDLPDNKYRLHNVDVYGKWKYNKNLAMRANYVYQNSSMTDWANDNVQQFSSNNLIATGMTSGSYVQNIFALALIYTGF